MATVKDLVTWKGKPVPWITRWTGEIIDDDDRVLRPFLNPAGQLQLNYVTDPENQEREANGILWQREGVSRGGEPEFSQVSTYRQRAAMRKRLCQVCGEKITSPVIQWLMAPGQLDVTQQGEAVTMNAPTCDECVEIALAKCPHLIKAGHFIVKVIEYELWGVYGEVVLWDGGSKISHQNNWNVSYDPAQLPEQLSFSAVMAKQQVVKFTKFKPLEA